MTTEADIEKLLSYGRMDLEAGYPEYARQYFESVLALDASNREAIEGLIRANEILSRMMPTPVEPTRAEPVEPPRKVSLGPTRPEVEPAKPRRTDEPTTKRKGKRRWLVLVVVPVVLLVVVFAYQRIEPMVQPTPTPVPTVTPWPTSTPRPLPTLRSGEEYECRLAVIGYNDVVKIELFLVEFGWSYAVLNLNAINISSRTVHVSPASFILVDSTGASVNYSSSNFRGRSTGVDLAPGTYTTGRIIFSYCMGDPKRLIYDDRLYDPIALNISLASCARVER